MAKLQKFGLPGEWSLPSSESATARRRPSPQLQIAELAEDFLRDYRIYGKSSEADAEARWRLYLKPFFASHRARRVTSGLLNKYVDIEYVETHPGTYALDALTPKARPYNSPTSILTAIP
jgi:hypothetical protein